DSTSDVSFTFNAVGVLSDPLGPFIFRESGTKTFSSGSLFGQTTQTRVMFKVTGLQNNVTLTFPPQIISSTGATLTTESGAQEALTNQSMSNTIVYVFADSPTSADQIDSFSITPGISTTGIAAGGTAFIQVGLGPIGAEKPSALFPSTAIPRYAEQFDP